MKPPPRPHSRLLALLIVGICVPDQISKALVREHMTLGERVALVPGLVELLHVENQGIAWGMLTGHPLRLPFVTFLSFATFLIILGWFRRLARDERALAISLGLVVSGACGNFIDRLLYRKVTDFVHLQAPKALAGVTEAITGSPSWAVFNLADVAITLGLVLFAWLGVRGRVIPPGLAAPSAEAVS